MVDHSVVRVEVRDDKYVLVCNCGWCSPAEPRAGDAGQAWDDHERQERSADTLRR